MGTHEIWTWTIVTKNHASIRGWSEIIPAPQISRSAVGSYSSFARTCDFYISLVPRIKHGKNAVKVPYKQRMMVERKGARSFL